MILHEAKNNHWNSEAEFLPMEMLALTPLSMGEPSFDAGENAGSRVFCENDAFIEGGFPMPCFAFGDEDDMEEEDFDDEDEEDFDDEDEDFDDDEDDEEDDDDDEDDDFDDDEDDYDYDEDDDFEYNEE